LLESAKLSVYLRNKICVFQHFNNFSILMVGRLLGGIATSILYSAFESWVIYEHHKVWCSPCLSCVVLPYLIFNSKHVMFVMALCAYMLGIHLSFSSFNLLNVYSTRKWRNIKAFTKCLHAIWRPVIKCRWFSVTITSL